MGKKSKVVVENGRLHSPAASNQEAPAIPVGSDAWFDWLVDNSRFVFADENGRFTARREVRRGQSYWYGYRRREGKLRKTYLGRAEDLSLDCLQKAGAKLAGLERPLSSPVADYPITNVGEETTFISTKFQPPLQRDNLLQRPRLLDQMVTPVILIHAPSGFGKGTLLTHWMASADKPVAWVSLDASDEEPARFWQVLGTAVGKLWPEWTPPVLRLSPDPNLNQIQDAIARFINAMTSANLPPFALILDSYHFINQELNHVAVSFLINHMPQTMQLLISSDTRLPFSLSQWRAAGILTEFTAEDLRLTMPEGVAFLQSQPATQSLAYTEMQELVRQTNGWTAGLQLASLALRRQGESLPPIEHLLGETAYFSEYFVENVLDRQETAVQQFLLQTSILKQLTGDLCDVVTAQENSAQLLEDLWQASLFVTKLGGEPIWYRYHPLFTDVLNRQLQHQEVRLLPELHQRAARWYQTNNVPEEAVRHLLAIQAWEEAAALIESVALQELHEKGEDSRLLRWVLQLPVEVVQQHRSLLEAFIHLTNFAFSQSYQEQFLKKVEENLLHIPEPERSTDEVEVLRHVQFLRQRIAQGQPAVLVGSDFQDSNEIFGMSETYLHGIQLFINQDYPQAEVIMSQMLEEADANRNLYLILTVGGGVAFTQWVQGRLRASEMVARQILQDAYERAGRWPEVSSTSFMVLAMTAYERNQLNEAQKLLEKAIEIDPNPTSSSVPAMCQVLQARIQVARGDPVAAQATLRASLSLDPDRRSVGWTRPDLMLWQAWIHIQQGDLSTAEQLLTSIQFNSEKKAIIPQQKDLYWLVLAEIQLAKGAFEQVEETLNLLTQAFPYGARNGPIVYPLVIQAAAQFSQSKVNQAQKTMEKALRMATAEDMKRPFLDRGATILPLLTLIDQTGRVTSDTRHFTQQLIETICQETGIIPADVQGEMAILSVAASISDRELEVLQLVSSGLSNQAIAVRMMITVSTVNTHLKNIYQKLDVHNRTEAVIRAQALNLPL